ncbi:M20 metallopeptidase family protein [Clostridium thermarum]|uniref:M20 metallopeptidase family protein n=1 Tax=Clostridium thermarum TaxID=1716543 RepID=UPI0015D668D0|nr:M20 family metallopeptidase [Clostridium thermarum]
MEKIDFLKSAANIYDELVEWRRHFHRNPELGFEEYKTTAKIKEFLKEEGIPYVETAGTGVCAIIQGGSIDEEKEKVIALRADIDALPLKDKKNCDYSSTVDGKMHACGHDAHMTILMGAAKILNGIKDSLKGTVKLLFEPAEETVGGARFMIEEGVLENPKVDAVIGLHVAEGIECGKIGIKKGVVNAASNPFNIKIIGKGGHGAHPEDTVDPVVIASHVIVALQSIVSREIPPADPAVVTVGSIHAGSAQNIIPEEVNISGIIRTMKSEHREYVIKRVTEIVEGITKTMRGSCEIDIQESYPCLYNNDYMVDMVKECAKEIIGADNVIDMDKPSMGVESFAYFSLERPSAFYFLGSGNAEKGITHPAHGSFFDIDENCLPIGVAIQCRAVYEYLNGETE